jgi:hypothetical protein
MTDDIEEQLEEIAALFVQVAEAATSEGDTIVLHEVSPVTLYFADRPERVAGHLTTRQFVEEWDKGANSFAVDPPNAVISFLDEGDEAPEDVVVVLRDPVIESGKLRYRVAVLSGRLPVRGASCSVFIDSFGRRPSRVPVRGTSKRNGRAFPAIDCDQDL